MEELRKIFFRFLAVADSEKILDMAPNKITELILKKCEQTISHSEARAQIQKLIKVHCCDVQCMIFINYDGERHFIPESLHRKSLCNTLAAISNYAQEIVSLYTIDGRPVDDVLFAQLFKLKSQSEDPILNLNAKKNRKRKASEALPSSSKRVKIKSRRVQDTAIGKQLEEMLELILKHQEKLNSNLAQLPSKAKLSQLQDELTAKLGDIVKASNSQRELIQQMEEREETLLKRVGSLESQVEFLMKKVTAISGILPEEVTGPTKIYSNLEVHSTRTVLEQQQQDKELREQHSIMKEQEKKIRQLEQRLSKRRERLSPIARSPKRAI